MSRAFTPGLRVTAATTVKRRRELPVSGTILVKKGESVSAAQIVAQAELPGDLVILKLPERMGIEVFEVIAGLKVAEGDRVEEGQLLCEHSGIFGLLKTRLRSPENGTVEFIAERTGHLGLRLKSKLVHVNAYIDGLVVEVEEGKSVVIENHAAFVQGIFGVGGEQHGSLCLLEVEGNEEIQERHVPLNCKGKILVGGAKISDEAIKKAATRGAVGIIAGAIDDTVLAEYLGYDLGVAITGDEQVPMTVIVTEGFGKLPMATRTIEVLSRFDGHSASINGATQVRAGAMRPEIIVSLDEARKVEEEAEALHLGLQVGSKIRIIRVPYFGKRGEVVELPRESVQIESGARTRVLKAKLEQGGEIVMVPRANVELI